MLNIIIFKDYQLDCGNTLAQQAAGHSFYNNIIINYKKGKSNLENLIMFLKKNKIKYNKIFSERPTLNDVFLSLTGKELRD